MALTDNSHGIIYEFVTQGRYVKVIAVCTRTGLEVSIVGDARENESQLRRVAGQKLMMMLEKKKPKPLSKGRGIIV